MRKGTKRKATHKGEPAEDHNNQPKGSPSKPSQNAKPEPRTKAAGKGTRKKAKVAKPEAEPEYLSEKRNLEDLWQNVFLVGTEWDKLENVYEYKWSFSTLEDAFEEGGKLHNEKVYLFGCTEAPMLHFRGQDKVTMVPVMVAVVSPFPPSEKIGITSVQRETEEIVPMKQMKMDWVPYIPLGNRESQVERLKNSQIFILSCTQRRAGLTHLKLECVKKFDYCLPYFYNPLQEDELEQSTVVQLLYPCDRVVACEFDWEVDELEDFVDELIKSDELPADHKEPFKDYVKEKVREAKKANREARKALRKAREELSNERRAAFENMRIYKFYPVPTADTPDVSSWKVPYINRYYGKAHMVI